MNENDLEKIIRELEEEIWAEFKPEFEKQGQAFQKKKMIDKLCGNKGGQFAEHCAKIILYPDNREINHWKKELFNLIGDINTYKLKNGNRLSSNEILDNFFKSGKEYSDFEEIINSTINKMKEKQNVPKEIDMQQKHKDYLTFCENLSEDLAIGEISQTNFYLLADNYLLS